MLQVKNPGIINDWKSPFQELKEISFFFFFYRLKRKQFPKNAWEPWENLSGRIHENGHLAAVQQQTEEAECVCDCEM